MSVVLSSLFLGRVFWGIAILSGTFSFGDTRQFDPPHGFGYMLVVMGSMVVVVGWIFGICLMIAGRSLKLRVRYNYCFAIAIASCALCTPFGTVLGIFTIIVLLRPSVKRLFDQHKLPVAV